MDYEELILAMAESEGDDCKSCPYAGIETCKNQCLEVVEIWNPNLKGANENA